MRALAAIFALVAVVCMVAAIAGMVTGRPGARAGFTVRLVALVSFAIAVALNIAAR
jgi:hypothetical protein